MVVIARRREASIGWPLLRRVDSPWSVRASSCLLGIVQYRDAFDPQKKSLGISVAKDFTRSKKRLIGSNGMVLADLVRGAKSSTGSGSPSSWTRPVPTRNVRRAMNLQPRRLPFGERVGHAHKGSRTILSMP